MIASDLPDPYHSDRLDVHHDHLGEHVGRFSAVVQKASSSRRQTVTDGTVEHFYPNQNLAAARAGALSRPPAANFAHIEETNKTKADTKEKKANKLPAYTINEIRIPDSTHIHRTSVSNSGKNAYLIDESDESPRHLEVVSNVDREEPELKKILENESEAEALLDTAMLPTMQVQKQSKLRPPTAKRLAVEKKPELSDGVRRAPPKPHSAKSFDEAQMQSVMASGRWESAEQEDSISSRHHHNSGISELNSHNSQQRDNTDDVIIEENGKPMHSASLVRKSGKFSESILGKDHGAIPNAGRDCLAVTYDETEQQCIAYTNNIEAIDALRLHASPTSDFSTRTLVKFCFPGSLKAFGGCAEFTSFRDYTLELAPREVFDGMPKGYAGLQACLELCVLSPNFYCKSASFMLDEGRCVLRDENSLSKSDYFREHLETNEIYLENGCDQFFQLPEQGVFSSNVIAQ
uniref:Apple domain-containing protein n=1 Tax=Parascaris univalens TaxID=6257 RepID=A0A915CHA0_PARUN